MSEVERSNEHESGSGGDDVRRYLVRLIILIAAALVLMSSVATWAWYRYGGALEANPPVSGPTSEPAMSK